MANIAEFFAQHLTAPGKPLYRRHADDDWSDVSVGELAGLIARWQAALESLGFQPGDRVAICLRNSIDWVALDLAALGLGIVVVPLYVDDNPDNVAWCAANAEVRALIVEGTRLGTALAAIGGGLAPVYVLHPDPGDALSAVASLLPAAAQAPRFATLPDDALATICYTSGTSGRPKGVMLSHGNIIANVNSCRETGMARPNDTFLSILPLSHMFERTGGYYLPLSLGARVVFCRGIALLAEDLAAQAPTVMFAVPRIFEKFLERINQALAPSPFRRWLFEQCATRGWRVEQRKAGWLEALALPVLRAAVARPILARLGGRLRLTVIGGAALDPVLSHTFIGLGLPMLQGYGMTEASPVVSVNRESDNDPDSVGPPLPGVEIKLGIAGELLVRGRNVMLGYWRNPEATHAAIDADAWLHTGDLADIRAGRIYLRGRLKDILVMSTGEKLSPQDAEFALLRDPLFEQVLLVGEGRPFLSLLAVSRQADDKVLLPRANELLKDFPRWVRVRRVIAVRDPWTIENGLLTPTLKLKRARVLDRYKSAIDALYAGQGG